MKQTYLTPDFKVVDLEEELPLCVSIDVSDEEGDGVADATTYRSTIWN